MFSEEVFLKKAGLFNSEVAKGQRRLNGSSTYFGDLEIDSRIVAETFIQLTYRETEGLSPKTSQIAEDIRSALVYLEEHLAEGVLSTEPIVRAFAEVLLTHKKPGS